MNKIKIPKNIADILDNYFELYQNNRMFYIYQRAAIPSLEDPKMKNQEYFKNATMAAKKLYDWSKLDKNNPEIVITYTNNLTSPKNMPELWEIVE